MMRFVPFTYCNGYGCGIAIVVILVMVCVIPLAGHQTNETSENWVSVENCKPELTKGTHTQNYIGGHTSFECQIASCINVSLVVYEKTNFHEETHWAPVFECINKTEYYTLELGEEAYTLNDRYEYAAFHSEHILYIRPLISSDAGTWRCVVFNQETRIAESQPLPLIIELSCRPEISEGSHTNFVIGGHTSLECDIDTCANASNIIYQKTGIFEPTQWTSVFKGTNKDEYKAIATGTEYSLDDRTEYTAFYSQHILYIKSVVLQDQGEWRCVVYDLENTTSRSHALDLYMATHCKPTITKGSHTKCYIGGHTSFECDISDCKHAQKIVFEKKGIHQTGQWTDVFEGINKHDYQALETGTDYFLANRTEYTAFYSRHILYIKRVLLEDQGEWRCAVYDLSYRRSESTPYYFFIETQCKPNISRSIHSQLVEDGHISLECEISSCTNVSRVIYEKTHIKAKQWLPIFEGVNMTDYKAFETGTNYSVANRTEYAAFYSQHILHINPLEFKDQGRWRCVVYDPKQESVFSNELTVNIPTNRESRTDADYSTTPFPSTLKPTDSSVPPMESLHPDSYDRGSMINIMIVGFVVLMWQCS